MAATEMPLAIYTFLVQLSIGSFIAIEVVRITGASRFDVPKANASFNKVVYAAFVLAVIGLIASFMHLKIPLHAPFALSNLATSWMTREIWLTVIFILLLLVYCVILLRKAASKSVWTALAILIAVVGLALVFCMANAYMNPVHPAWDTPSTICVFYATTFLVGPAFAAAALSIFAKGDIKKDAGSASSLESAKTGVLAVSACAGMIALAVASIATTLSLCNLAASGEHAALASVVGLAEGYNALFLVRMVFAFAGVLCMGVALACDLRKAQKRASADIWAFASCALLIVAEFIGRNLFYATAVQIGI